MSAELPQDDLNLDKVDHVAIHVANLEAAIKWYQTSFNCKVIFQDTSQALLEFANIKLSLVLPSSQPPHIAILKNNAHTYGKLREKREGIVSTFVADPTGNVVELVATPQGCNLRRAK